MAAADSVLSQGLGRLLAIAENYPQLQSSQNFRDLQTQLEGTENRISVARQDYNTAVGEYNSYIRRFPNNLTAKVFGMGKPRDYFEASQGAAQPPTVKFYERGSGAAGQLGRWAGTKTKRPSEMIPKAASC